MDERIRRMVAYSAAGRVNHSFSSSIYSYAEDKRCQMSKNYDFADQCHFSGSDRGNLYHYGACAHVQLRVIGNVFNGYDFGSETHFQGNVNGQAVQVYDYGEGAYFKYAV